MNRAIKDSQVFGRRFQPKPGNETRLNFILATAAPKRGINNKNEEFDINISTMRIATFFSFCSRLFWLVLFRTEGRPGHNNGIEEEIIGNDSFPRFSDRVIIKREQLVTNACSILVFLEQQKTLIHKVSEREKLPATYNSDRNQTIRPEEIETFYPQIEFDRTQELKTLIW